MCALAAGCASESPAGVARFGFTPEPEAAAVAPPSDIADQVTTAAAAAVSGSDMSLQECTDRAALIPRGDCIAIIAAAIEVCERLDCFNPNPDNSSEPQ